MQTVHGPANWPRADRPVPVSSSLHGTGDDYACFDRRCSAAHAPVSCVQQLPGGYAEAISTVELTPAYITRHLVFLAAGQDAHLLGFCSLIRDPPELDMLFVADQAQGRGIGRLLVDHMIERTRRSRLAGGRVVSHPPAEGFCSRLGARRIGTVPAKPPMTTWERPELWFTIT
ncbi:GNAT family N-acetyltransferase [Streptomyces sp. STR69]|uniref:GNAT family N-acetyltransferase n=1 Tax=Streptomyces sp. STR69 TaxID=1796942 RepID=UPI0021C75418|nr:GNAT family N-acetyltransferase [Streptomyces sp. STR69]